MAAAAAFEGVCLIGVRREINMRVGGGRILLDGYQIGLYFLLEWFVLGFLPWETIRQIFNITACSLRIPCYGVSRIEDLLARGSGETRDRGKNC